jgi:hypothetical protein
VFPISVTYLPQRPDIFVTPITAIFLADLEQRVRLFPHPRPPAVDIIVQGLAADQTEAVVFGEATPVGFSTLMTVGIKIFNKSKQSKQRLKN